MSSAEAELLQAFTQYLDDWRTTPYGLEARRYGIGVRYRQQVGPCQWAFVVTAAPLGNTIRRTAKEIAHELELSPGSVSKSSKRLLVDGWLQVAYTAGSVSFYRAGRKVMNLAVAGIEDLLLAQVHRLPVPAAGDAE